MDTVTTDCKVSRKHSVIQKEGNKLACVMKYPVNVVGRDSSVGIATAYGLDGPGIESRWGRDFLHLSRPALRPTQPPVQWVPGLSTG